MPRHDPARDDRLAAALRQNLRRRKAQARGAAAVPVPDTPDPLTPPDPPAEPPTS